MGPLQHQKNTIFFTNFERITDVPHQKAPTKDAFHEEGIYTLLYPVNAPFRLYGTRRVDWVAHRPREVASRWLSRMPGHSRKIRGLLPHYKQLNFGGGRDWLGATATALMGITQAGDKKQCGFEKLSASSR